MQDPPTAETPLACGHVTEVSRAGDTVRRPWRPHTPAVHALLRHLETAGFDGAPRALGRDEHGREVLTYVAGNAGSGVPPANVWSDRTLSDLARLIRRMHDAASPVTGEDLPWASPPPPGVPVETICHNDLAPWNTIFVAERPVAFIDWDWAGPGPRNWDLAYALWHWLPLYPLWRRTDVGAPGRPRLLARARLFCQAYGTALDHELLTMIPARVLATVEGICRLADEGDLAHQRLWAAARPGLEAELAFTRRWVALVTRRSRRRA